LTDNRLKKLLYNPSNRNFLLKNKVDYLFKQRQVSFLFSRQVSSKALLDLLKQNMTEIEGLNGHAVEVAMETDASHDHVCPGHQRKN
jgi:ketopantoate reductase